MKTASHMPPFEEVKATRRPTRAKQVSSNPRSTAEWMTFINQSITAEWSTHKIPATMGSPRCCTSVRGATAMVSLDTTTLPKNRLTIQFRVLCAWPLTRCRALAVRVSGNVRECQGVSGSVRVSDPRGLVCSVRDCQGLSECQECQECQEVSGRPAPCGLAQLSATHRDSVLRAHARARAPLGACGARGRGHGPSRSDPAQ